jgi:hypothetical protein
MKSNLTKYLLWVIISVVLLSCDVGKNRKKINFKGDLYYTNIMPTETGIPDKRVFIKFYKTGELHKVVSNKSIKDVYSNIDKDYDIKTTYKEINGYYKFNYNLDLTVGYGLKGETELREYWFYCYTLNEVSDTIIIETQSQWVKDKKGSPHIFRLEYYKYNPKKE